MTHFESKSIENIITIIDNQTGQHYDLKLVIGLTLAKDMCRLEARIE
jgi:hypothetical protein